MGIQPESDSCSAESILPVRSRDLPNDYELMDDELVKLLKTAVEHELAR